MATGLKLGIMILPSEKFVSRLLPVWVWQSRVLQVVENQLVYASLTCRSSTISGKNIATLSNIGLV